MVPQIFVIRRLARTALLGQLATHLQPTRFSLLFGKYGWKYKTGQGGNNPQVNKWNLSQISEPEKTNKKQIEVELGRGGGPVAVLTPASQS